MSGLTFKDSPQMHIALERSKYIYIANLHAPDDSPNTDGIHIQNSHKISIRKSNIATGNTPISTNFIIFSISFLY